MTAYQFSSSNFTQMTVYQFSSNDFTQWQPISVVAVISLNDSL